MPIELKDAQSTAEALARAATDVAVLQLHYEMKRRAREWKRAVDDVLKAEEGELTIELLGAVIPGMEVSTSEGWCMIVRKLFQGGQQSLHVEDDRGKPLYINFSGDLSPVAVRS